MSATDLFVAALRLLLVAGLYAFLLAIALVLARGLWPRPAAAAAVPQVSRRIRLLVVDAQGATLKGSYDVEDRAVIGRDPACGVHLPPMYVSARHARLSFDNGQWWLEDLGSRNKTFVDGDEAPAGRPVPVSPGQEITIAGIRLHIQDNSIVQSP
jgi:pSer/pThr/pTyr-binding forkhead associated (FHA) protein